MKKIVLIPFFLLIAGCSGFLKQSWVDFRAHYNTYYNAEENFQTGVEKVSNQSVEINPEESLVLVHRQPVQAGAEDFQQAIEKGAQILSRYPESKWVDDALFIMGKSYYYRQEYYLAIQKFEELLALSENTELQQEAIIWKGNSLLQLELYGRGISFIQEQIDEYEFWEQHYRAETGVLLAEHHAGLGNWDQAATYLGNYLVDLEENSFKARTYFLYGQILERQQRYGEAFFAYDRVSPLFPDYQYVFWAELNKGKIARIEGNTDIAAEVFEAMERNDKNFDRYDEIAFQLAKTEQTKGNYRQAENRYNQLLHSSNNTPSQHIQAKTYYELGEIYSKVFDNYEIASAYYDSSSARASQVVTDQNETENVSEQASSYARYASLRREEAEIDSLLQLGNMSDQQIDSVLQVIRTQRIAELNEENADQNNTKVLANTDEQVEDFTTESTTNAGFGFLAHRSEERVEQSRNAFRAIWGDRPLADNWRRAEAVRNVSSQNIEETSTPTREVVYSDADLGIHVEDIPRDETSKRALRNRLANVWYELGNILFLNLDQPENAAAYFKKIIDEQPSDQLVARTKYALYELCNVTGDTAEAERWKKQILSEHPESIFAERIRERAGETVPIDSSEISREKMLQKVSNIEQSADSISTVQQAEQYRELALENTSSDLAPHVHYRAIETYIELAKSNADSSRYASYWRARDDDLNTGPKIDSTAALADTVTEMPLSEPQHPFGGAYWDSVSVLIEEYQNSFDEQPHGSQIEEIRSAIALETPKVKEKIETCENLGIEPRANPDMETFLQEVELPEKLRNQRLSGSIAFEITILGNGSVADYRLVSEQTIPELEKAYAQAIEEHLRFYAIEELQVEAVRCELTFPIKN